MNYEYGTLRSTKFRNKYCEYSRYLTYFLSEKKSYTPRYWERLWRHSFTEIWSLEYETEQIPFARGNWSTWSIRAVSSSFFLWSILRVLAVFPGSIYSGYSGYCKVSISDVLCGGCCSACILGVLYTAHHIPSTRSIWVFSTGDTPSTRRINSGHHNSRVPQYSQYQQYPEYRTETYITSSMYRE